MLRKRSLLIVLSSFLLSLMIIISSNGMQIKAKEKQAKFNKQYTGKVDGYHNTTYILKVPADGVFYIRYSSKGDYTKVDILSEYQGKGFFIPRIYTQNKSVKTKSKKVKKGDCLSVDVYVQRPPMNAKYKIKFCYKKNKKKKSNTKIYESTFSKKYKTSPLITDLYIKNGKCKVKGSFVLVNKNYQTVKKYASKKRTYKISKKFNIYLNDIDSSYKVPKSQWNSELKKLSNTNLCIRMYVKNNQLTKITFCP